MTPEQRVRLRDAAEKATPGMGLDEHAIRFKLEANPAAVLAILDALDAAEKEREAMTLAICGGEDAPGYASSLSHETVLRLVEENHATLRSYSDLAFDGDGATWKVRATAAEARVALLEGLLKDAVNWSEYEDEIAEAISDSMDMDWTSQDGARAVVRFLNTIAAGRAILAPGGEA